MEEKRKPRLWLLWLAIPAMLAMYALGAGPYVWLMRRGHLPKTSVVTKFYLPYTWVVDCMPKHVQRVSEWYIRQWM